ncbi:hypothetical protein ACFYN3_31055 [Streptomyces lavendulae]|uniref:hypothetical protein n=1 Tax=Streptomyces lavendulae TaxID=1914 RepID=UPI0036B7326E
MPSEQDDKTKAAKAHAANQERFMSRGTGRSCQDCRGTAAREGSKSGCGTCDENVRSALLAFPETYVHLHMKMKKDETKGISSPLFRKAGKRRKGPSAPVRISPLSLAQLGADIVIKWGDSAFPRNQHLHCGSKTGTLLQESCLKIAGNLAKAFSCADSESYALDLLATYEKSRDILGWSSPAAHLAPPCISCEMRTLILSQDGQVDCFRCRTIWVHETWDSIRGQHPTFPAHLDEIHHARS